MPRSLTILASFVLLIPALHAEIPPPPDGLSKAYEQAGRDLASGKDRKLVLDALRDAVRLHPKSSYLPEATRLLMDLNYSVENPAKADDSPERRIAETKVPYYLLGYSDNWDEARRSYRDARSTDPVARLLTADRTVIERLIPMLKDDSPTRAFQENALDRGGLPSIPRVSDFALALIEYHSLCRFHDNSSSGTPFHTVPDDERTRVIQRIALWWKENRNESVAAGIRDQIPFADYHAKVWMARTLIRLGEKAKNRADRDHGLDVLRQMVRDGAGSHPSVYAASALAEYGDLSPRDFFFDLWKSTLGQPGIIRDPGIAFYLAEHGGRREWELLYAVAVEDTQNNRDAGGGAIWAAVVNSTEPDTTPFVIPILGLVLQQEHTPGSRSVAGSAEVQSFTYSDKAVEHLQQKTGLDFGYKPPAKLAERNAAIEKAKTWWTAEGQKKYTFDYIEAELVKKAKK
jgi:hypothetical protein